MTDTLLAIIGAILVGASGVAYVFEGIRADAKIEKLEKTVKDLENRLHTLEWESDKKGLAETWKQN